MFYQKFFEESEINFRELGEQLGIEAITVSIIKQPPGMTNPMHRDTFYQINKKFPNDERLKVRANIQLLDWKDGHFLQFNDKVVTHWKANTGYMWDSSVLHLAANAGLEDRYSLQVSGFYPMKTLPDLKNEPFGGAWSIYDNQLLNFIKNRFVNPFYDPNIDHFLKKYRTWAFKNHKVKGIDEFTNLCYANGTTEVFDKFYQNTRSKD